MRTRREGVGRRIEKFAKAAALAAGIAAAAEVGGSPEKKLPPQVAEQLELYEQQTTALGDADIVRELSRCCVFIEGGPRINHIAVPENERGSISVGGFIDKSIQKMRSSLGEQDLLVVQIDFNSITEQFRGAFYLADLKAMFLNQSPTIQKDFKRRSFEDFLYLDVIQKERSDKISASFRQQESTAKILNEAEETYQRRLQTPNKRLGLLPNDLLTRYNQQIVDNAVTYRSQREFQRIITESNLAHETFHHFYSHQFGEKGYKGPSIADLLFLAFTQSQKRFGSDLPDYYTYLGASDMTTLLKQVIGKDLLYTPAELHTICEHIANRYDLRRLPPPGADVEVLHEQLYHFLGEYLARVFNGLNGFTPELMEQRIKSATAQFGIPDTRDSAMYKKWYHTPTKEERLAFAGMSWKGRPLIQENNH